MAIDTHTKRRSVLGMGIISFVIPPLADGTIAATDRMHFAGLYGGIDPGGVAPGLQTDSLHIFSTSDSEPEKVSDSGDNVLIEGDVEIKGTMYAAGANITGSEFNVTSVITTYTIVTTDDMVFANSTPGDFTVTMPTGVLGGQTYTIKNTGNGEITVASTALIDGAATATLPSKVAFRITFDGTTWWIA